jgi:PKD repeat protein
MAFWDPVNFDYTFESDDVVVTAEGEIQSASFDSYVDGGSEQCPVEINLFDLSDNPPPDPVANIDASVQSGSLPLEVQFFGDGSTGIQTYSWDFDNGQTSVAANPLMTFTESGTYIVSLVVVGPGGQDNATITISVNPPQGDECSNPIPVQQGFNPIDTTWMTTGTVPLPGNCSVGAVGSYSRDAWFSFTPSFTGKINVNTCSGASFDTVLAVYQAGDCSSISENLIGCNDDFCGPPSRVIVDVVAGDGYLFRVGGYSISSAGTASLEITVCQGSGTYTATSQQLGSGRSRDVELGDLDGDGDLDAFIGNSTGDAINRVWFNNGSGNFSVGGQALGSFNTHGLALGDLDGDGDLDAYVGNYADDGDRVYLNDGSGFFTENQITYFGTTEHVELGDLDGDGDLDVFSVDRNHGCFIRGNNGSGIFTTSAQEFNFFGARSVALGDIDNDGDLDAVVGISGSFPNRVYINDGTGFFIETTQQLGSYSTFDVELGDLDGDGDLDVFEANVSSASPLNSTNRIYLNNGSGVYSVTSLQMETFTSMDVELGDVDGDGDLDAVVANGVTNPEQNNVWYNNGNASFTAPFVSLTGSSVSYGLALGDLNGDTFLDVFVAEYREGTPITGIPNQVYINDGCEP